jgi:RNA polymerase sigma-70 factor (ECF subfamily)
MTPARQGQVHAWPARIHGDPARPVLQLSLRPDSGRFRSLVSSTGRLYSKQTRRPPRAVRLGIAHGAAHGMPERPPQTPPNPPAPPHATTRRLRSGPYLRYTDAQLVALVRSGHSAAYDELVERYQNAARARALAVIGDYQAAEDIAQEAFIKAYSALSTLTEAQKFGGWLLTIVQHTALDHLRARHENMSLETMREQGFEAPRPTRGLLIEKMQDREEELRVLEALGDLREDYREIIVLKHVEKLSYKDIAERLGMSVSAVGEKLSRVRGLLKRRLDKQRVPRAGEEAEDDHLEPDEE